MNASFFKSSFSVHRLVGFYRVVISAASFVPEFVAALFFVQAREANKRADTINEQLVRSERISQATELALSADEETRNRLTGVIIEQLLNLTAKGQEISMANSPQQLSA